MPSAGFESLIGAVKRPQIYAFERTATRMCWIKAVTVIIINIVMIIIIIIIIIIA
jgi:hypothetical protein